MMNIDNHSRCIVAYEASQVTNILLNGESVPQSARIANVDAFYANKGDTITFSPTANHRPWFGTGVNGRVTNFAPFETTLTFIVTSDTVYLGGQYYASGKSVEEVDEEIRKSSQE